MYTCSLVSNVLTKYYVTDVIRSLLKYSCASARCPSRLSSFPCLAFATPARHRRGQDDCDEFVHAGIYTAIKKCVCCVVKPRWAWGVPCQRVVCSDLVSAGEVQCSHSARKVIRFLRLSDYLSICSLQFQRCFVMDHRNCHVNNSTLTAKASRHCSAHDDSGV